MRNPREKLLLYICDGCKRTEVNYKMFDKHRPAAAFDRGEVKHYMIVIRGKKHGFDYIWNYPRMGEKGIKK